MYVQSITADYIKNNRECFLIGDNNRYGVKVIKEDGFYLTYVVKCLVTKGGAYFGYSMTSIWNSFSDPKEAHNWANYQLNRSIESIQEEDTYTTTLCIKVRN